MWWRRNASARALNPLAPSFKGAIYNRTSSRTPISKFPAQCDVHCQGHRPKSFSHLSADPYDREADTGDKTFDKVRRIGSGDQFVKWHKLERRFFANDLVHDLFGANCYIHAKACLRNPLSIVRRASNLKRPAREAASTASAIAVLRPISPALVISASRQPPQNVMLLRWPSGASAIVLTIPSS